MKDLSELLPERISDEEAYNLVNFFMSLALELDSRYFTQICRYTNNTLNYPKYLQGKLDDELPF
jgi:hypothetical protein